MAEGLLIFLRLPGAWFRAQTYFGREKVMKKVGLLSAFALVLLQVGVASAQDYPIMDMVAQKLIQKYQQSTCEQLWQQKSEPKTQREQEFIQILRDDPQMRKAFLDKVAEPVLNKMIECGMIP
jgi:hypothetical protein